MSLQYVNFKLTINPLGAEMIWLALLILIIAVFFVQKFLTQKQNVIIHETPSIEIALTPDQITLIQQTWNQILPDKEQFGDIFYNKLFECDPSVRALFKNDMKLQSDKFISTLSRIVFLIDKVDKFIPLLQEMGRRHVTYGVTDAQYDIAGAALLSTLEQGLGETYTEKVKQAWTSAYGVIANIMIEAGRDAKPA